MTTSTPRETFTLPGLNPLRARRNLAPAALYEEALRRAEGMVTDHGALSVITTPHTGRSPNDKFVVSETSSAAHIWWEKNARLDEAAFDRLHEQVVAHLEAQELFVQDLYCGADPAYRLPVRFVTPNAWHAHFVRNMFIRPGATELAAFTPELHGAARAGVPGRPGTARHPDRHVHRASLRPPHDPDRRHPVRRRAQEVDLHRDELPAARAGRLPDALLGQHRGRGRHRALLRPVGHRQDHPLGRPRPGA